MKGLDKVFNEKNLKVVGQVAKRSCNVIVPVLVMALSTLSVGEVMDVIRYNGNVGYDDAVKAIMDSSIPSYDKSRIMQFLKRDENSEYYKAVIHTIKSSMPSYTKVEIIQNLCKTE